MKRMTKKTRKRKAAAVILGAVMGVYSPMTAFASSPEFARTSEEWAGLRDNFLEYEEIEGLIQEYNADVQNNQYEYQKFVNEYGRTRDDIAQKYREQADDLEAGMTGEDGMAMVNDFQLQQQADQLREQADDYVEDSKVQYLSNRMNECRLIMEAQTSFISYYKDKIEEKTAQSTLNLLEQEFELLKLQRQAGIITETRMLEQQETIEKQRKTVTDAISQTESDRQNLIVLCGWRSSGQPEIGDIPLMEEAVWNTIDLEADMTAAKENNYTLQINRRKLENAQDKDNQSKIQRTIDDNIRKIEVSVTEAWQTLQSAIRSSEQAEADRTVSERELAEMSQKYNAGMITLYDYQEAENDLKEKQCALEMKQLDLFQALETYRWNISGMADAE